MDRLAPIRDIAPPIEQLPESHWWLWPLAAVIAVLFVLVFRHLRHRHTPSAPDNNLSPVPKSPLEQALEAIEQLQSTKLIENNRSKTFFTRLNRILREYLAATCKTYTIPRTSGELITTPEISARLTPQTSEAFACFLRDCDRFKFADITARGQAADKACDSCRKLIKAIDDAQGDI